MSPLTNVSELWHPTPDYVQRSRLLRFMQRHRIADYPALYDRSIGEMEWFWKAALEEMGIEWASPYTRVLDLSKGPSESDVQAWADEHKVRVLNVAGPRESKCPGIYAQAAQFLRTIFSR